MILNFPGRKAPSPSVTTDPARTITRVPASLAPHAGSARGYLGRDGRVAGSDRGLHNLGVIVDERRDRASAEPRRHRATTARAAGRRSPQMNLGVRQAVFREPVGSPAAAIRTTGQPSNLVLRASSLTSVMPSTSRISYRRLVKSHPVASAGPRYGAAGAEHRRRRRRCRRRPPSRSRAYVPGGWDDGARALSRAPTPV